MELTKSINASTISASVKHPSVSFFARWGYSSRALVYFIVGFFAFTAAFGEGRVVDSKGALASLLDEPFGITLLWITSVGLVSYSLWRGIQSLMDVDNHGKDLKGLAIRSGLFISALTHISLAVWTVNLALGDQSKGSGSGEWVGWLLSQPGGKIYVFIVASLILGAGIAQAVKGYKSGFLKYCSKIRSKPLLKRLSQIGLIAKGIAFALISYLFYRVVFFNADQENNGLSTALQLVHQQTLGWLLLSVMGLGLICFGIYSAIEAYCREI